MSDAGMPVGAALAAYYDQLGNKYDPDTAALDHVYLGPEYSDEEIRQALESHSGGAL
jgi:predicted NodU family carbamoyl transferase